MRSLIVSLAAAVLAAGCPSGGGGGPCYGPDQVFPSPSVERVESIDGAALTLKVGWNSDSTIPPAFYAEPLLVPQNDQTRAARIMLNDAGPEGALVSFQEHGPAQLAFDIEYREGVLRCRHPGMDDTFILRVSTSWLEDGGIDNAAFTIEERVGAL